MTLDDDRAGGAVGVAARREVDLCEVDLHEVDLREVGLREVGLRNADLRNADLLVAERPLIDAAVRLRDIADRLDAGSLENRSDLATGTLLDAEVGGVRCVLIEQRRRQAPLSPREREIARMVSRGLTNKAIASALEISLWTVSTHLRRIFAKLDVNSRAEMVTVWWSTSTRVPAGR